MTFTHLFVEVSSTEKQNLPCVPNLLIRNFHSSTYIWCHDQSDGAFYDLLIELSPKIIQQHRLVQLFAKYHTYVESSLEHERLHVSDAIFSPLVIGAIL